MPFNMTQRMLCAAQHAYQITGNTPDFPVALIEELPRPGVVGYQGLVSAHQSIGLGIDAALVGVIREGVVVGLRGTLSPEDMPRNPLKTLADWAIEQSEIIAMAADWLNDTGIELRPATFGDSPFPGRVHEKFAASFDRLWDAVRQQVARRQHEAPKRIYVAGHSKGGALCALFAWALAETFPEHQIVVRAFAPARVGDLDFARAYNARLPNHVQFEFATDLVPHLPGQAKWLRDMGFPPELAARLAGIDPGYGNVGQLCYIQADGHWLTQAEITPAERVARLLAHAAARPGDLSFIAASHALSPGYAAGRFDDLCARLGPDIVDAP